MMKNYCLAVLLALLLCESSHGEEISFFGYRVVEVFPHDENAFTQGLFFRDGWLYESTGLRGSSSIRKVSLDTGRVEQIHRFDQQYFGEGIVDWKESLIAVTWKSGLGFVFSIDDFTDRGGFSYDGEGWGLTRSGSQLILSDGTATLRFLDPVSFEVQNQVTVTIGGRAVRNLNELEWVDGDIYSNVWGTDQVVVIDPDTGAVKGIIELSGLLSDAEKLGTKADVLNGIAYDPEAGRLFVTGKNWPKLFEIELIDKTMEN